MGPQDSEEVCSHCSLAVEKVGCWYRLQLIGVLLADGHAICPDCRTRINCGTVGIANLEQRHRGKKICRETTCTRTYWCSHPLWSWGYSCERYLVWLVLSSITSLPILPNERKRYQQEPTHKFRDVKRLSCKYKLLLPCSRRVNCILTLLQRADSLSRLHKVRTCHLEIFHEISLHTKTQKPTSIRQTQAPLASVWLWAVRNENDLGEALENDH